MEALRARLTGASRLAVKIGSALIVDSADGTPRRAWLSGVAQDLAEARARGAEVMVISSGSIALGRRVLGLPAGALALDQAQAAAAVGQIQLARAWTEALAPHGLTAAQVLLTLEDTRDRRRYLNGRATLNTLLSLGAVPVVNENDTVATDEIRFGDNDRLAARVALMAGADLLVLLSDVDGLYDANPRERPDARRLTLVEQVTPEIEAMASGIGTEGARGGMITKLIAAKTAMRGGCAMAICRGDVPRPLSALAAGGAATWFRPEASPLTARKAWIAGMKPLGRLIVDAGAARALRRGRSLLPAGLSRIEGDFGRGDPVILADAAGDAVGAALVGYAADEARVIAGRQSSEFEALLGHQGRAEIAHANDIVIWDAGETPAPVVAEAEEAE